MDNGGRLVRLLSPDLPPLPGRVLWQTQPLPGTPWQLHLVHDTHSSIADSRWAAAAGGGGWLALALLCLLYTYPSPRDGLLSRMPSSA